MTRGRNFMSMSNVQRSMLRTTYRHLKTNELASLIDESIGRTHRPLDTEQTEKERDTVVPASCLIDYALSAKNVRRTVHFAPRCRCQKNNDDDWRPYELASSYTLAYACAP